jgi:hypothetical protein
MSDSAVASESYVHYLTQWKIVGNSEVHNLPYADIPLGYTKCKYLSFDNGQYFDSGILTSNDIGIRIKFATSTQMNTIIGARKSGSSSAYLFGYFDSNGTTVYVGYGGSSKSVSLTKNYIDGNTHTLILDSTQAKIDNEDISFTRGTGTEFFNILIGTWNNNGAADSVNAKYSGKIEEVKIYNSNQTLGNFIPCLDDNNVPCLYDTISETTLYNQGTGTCGYEIEPQPTEIWSCGDLEQDGKYHVKISNGVTIFDIPLTEPLRKVDNVADTIEFANGVATLTRNFASADLGSFTWLTRSTKQTGKNRYSTSSNLEVLPNCIGLLPNTTIIATALCSKYNVLAYGDTYYNNEGIEVFDSSNVSNGQIIIYDSNVDTLTRSDFKNYIQGVELIYQITPTTELVDAPQIAEADSYSCVISPGGKAVSWSSFLTE